MSSNRARHLRKEEGTPSYMVVDEALIRLFRTKVFQWIRPEQVAHETMRRWLPESVDLQLDLL